MSFRRKTLIYFSSIVVAFIVFVYILLNQLTLQGYIKLENELLLKSCRSIIAEIEKSRKPLDILVRDWAAWDATYRFINDANKDYIISNLTDTTFIDSNLNFIVFTNSKGKIVHYKYFDFKKKKAIPLPKELKKYFTRGGYFSKHESLTSKKSGIFICNSDIVVATSRPILTSKNMGPIRGSLTMGKLFNSEYQKMIVTAINKPLSIYYYNDAKISMDIRDDLEKKAIASKIIDKNRIAGYALIRDINNSPILIFKIILPRKIYHFGKKNIQYFILLFLAGGFLFCIAIIYMLEKHIISRLYSLSKKVIRIGEKGDFSIRISVSGNDELTSLTVAINRMLQNLQDANIEINTLSGLLPICSHCKKIRDDRGYWNQIEKYIENNTDALFSHGLCPKCAEELYGDKEWYIKSKKKKE